MNLKFVVNDYVLIWNLLFQASITEKIHAFKQKLWVNYKKQYNLTFRDNIPMLKDPKNFIPDDDTIYNIVKDSDEYQTVYKSAERFRLELIKKWDEIKKESLVDLKSIIRFDIKIYHVLTLTPRLNIIDITKPKSAKVNTIVWGKKYQTPEETIINLIYQIVNKELKDYQEDYQDLIQAIVEMAVLNEYATRLYKKSAYLSGDPALKFLKRQIYPYWLMYLGATKEEMINYMMRDKIAFDIDDYNYEKRLQKMDLYGFIDFCIKNQKSIVKIEELEII